VVVWEGDPGEGGGTVVLCFDEMGSEGVSRCWPESN
jgi:hypothetical protein